MNILGAVAFALLPSAGFAATCGGDVACSVDGGAYRIELPDGGPAKGVLVFFHGYKSSAALQMRHRALVEVAHARGMAFVAVDGLNGTWSHPGAPAKFRNEAHFVGRVFGDLERRFGFTAKTIVVSGFSQGASMAWYTLCLQGDRVAGAVTFSGVFWDPLPQPSDCVAAIPPVVHFHGRADRTFPLAGRAIGDAHHQGDTFESMAVVRERALCQAPVAAGKIIGGIACDVAPACSRGEIALCLHEGGHQVQPDHLDAGLANIGF